MHTLREGEVVSEAVDAATYLRETARVMLARANELDPMELDIEGSGSPGAALIAQERIRQIAVEGYTAEHDEAHPGTTLAWAAFCYLERVAQNRLPQQDPSVPYNWPFDRGEWKPKPTEMRNLVVAAALIAADIDRRWREGERP